MKHTTLLAVLLSIFCVAAAKKNPPLTIRFHLEGTPSDGEKFVAPVQLMNPPRQTTISIIPLVNETDIIAFHPFQAKDGTQGAYFKLDFHGSKVLQAFTTRHRDRIVVALVDGRQVVNMKVDKPINDGIILISSGLSSAEVEKMREQFRLIGKEEDPTKAKSRTLKKLVAGDLDKMADPDPDMAPSKATPTPIPVSTPPPKSTPPPAAAASPRR